MIVIGVDPDSDKHGVAIYQDKKLIELKSLRLIDLIGVFRYYEHKNPVLHIEDVCGQNSAFRKKHVANAKAGTAINRNIGMCQQAQVEVERMAEYYGIEVVKHRISKAWKKDRGLFESVTGWNKSSNEDTRSAAYFGYLGCK